MAVDQDLLDQIAASVADLYREVEAALVKTVAQRLRADLPLPSPFQETKLDAIRKLQASARLIVASLQATRARIIRQAIADAYRSGGDAAVADLPASWFPKSGIGQQARAATAVVPNARVVENIAQALHRDVGRVDANILRAPVDAYRAVQAGAAARIITGSYTRREASQAAWSQLIERGIVDFTDRAGRRWKLSSYVEMMARTNAQRAAVQGQTDRLESIGIDLVYISDNVQECKICRRYESQVLRRDAGPTGKIQVEHATRDGEMVTVDVIDTLPGAMAKGLFHPNCRHSASAYLPGVTKLKTGTADPEGDKARQRQRYLERKIRAAKQLEVGALDEPAKKAARVKVRAAQAALRDHLKAHPDLKRLPYREQIGAGNIPRGEAPGGPITPLQPPVQGQLPATPSSPDADQGRVQAEKAAARAAAEVKAKQEAERQAAEQKAKQEAEAKALAEAKAKAEAEAKAKAEEAAKKAAEEAARKAAIEQAKREAAEAARRAAAEKARQEAARKAAPGMRHGVRHRTNQAGLDWAHTQLPSIRNLPAEQREAIVDYTGFDYTLINNGLRGEKLTAAERMRFDRLVSNIDAAFNSSRAPEPVLVHRGTDSGYSRNGLGVDIFQPEQMYALVGKTFKEAGFWSTSVGKGERDGNQIQLMIRVPAGYPMLDVMPISKYGEDELEVLLQRGAHYVVHAVYKQLDNWVLEVEIVSDGWTPPPGWKPDPYGPDDGPGSEKGA
ncbi:phage minor capsid protein [Nonomuraea sp. NPDC059194]|uniref:phage minor capsid protein n=1 Tax=Nonomuraea sp. NPDC059194 TaxID=3346764 RepID=UPI0036AFFE0B